MVPTVFLDSKFRYNSFYYFFGSYNEYMTSWFKNSDGSDFASCCWEDEAGLEGFIPPCNNVEINWSKFLFLILILLLKKIFKITLDVPEKALWFLT